MCIGMVGVADDGLVVAVLHSLVDFAVEGDNLGTVRLLSLVLPHLPQRRTTARVADTGY